MTFPEFDLPTPFGKATLPDYKVVPFYFLRLNGRRRVAFMQSVALLPFDVLPAIPPRIRTTIMNMHREKLMTLLTEAERRSYEERVKKLPPPVALEQVFMEIAE